MKLCAIALDGDSYEPLPAVEEDEFVQLADGALRNASEWQRARLEALTGLESFESSDRAERQRKPPPDLGDPRAVGWTYLIAQDEPAAKDIAQILAPLAHLRGMPDPAQPLKFERGRSPWALLDEYENPPDGGDRPHYTLIVGGPERVPFRFQALLGITGAVGRVAFDSLSDLETYAKKLISQATATQPISSNESLWLATDGGERDVTHLSRHYLVGRLVEEAQKTSTLCTLFGEGATKEALLARADTKPALVFTASHGLAPPRKGLEVQQRLTGAICCQRDGFDTVEDWLLTADDLPVSSPFLEGSVFFQFACFGYGCPAQSDFAHWGAATPGQTKQLAERDFISAIPKRLLANPRGPLCYIGHVDAAWLHSFADPEDPTAKERRDTRLKPFSSAVRALLGIEPAGIAMGDLGKQYGIGNALLAEAFDQAQRHKDKASLPTLVDELIRRSDAQNHLIFGDPAVRLRIAE